MKVNKALQLLDELHKERITYDEYTILHEALKEAIDIEIKLQDLISKVKEVLNG